MAIDERREVYPKQSTMILNNVEMHGCMRKDDSSAIFEHNIDCAWSGEHSRESVPHERHA
jgi:hypothetical protein